MPVAATVSPVDYRHCNDDLFPPSLKSFRQIFFRFAFTIIKSNFTPIIKTTLETRNEPTMKIPKLKLSLGQLAWAINLGQEVPKIKRDQLNYLRKLGIPHQATVNPPGSGNRVTYGYEDLVECGLALYLFNHGMRPADISNALLKEPTLMKDLYQDAISEHPEGYLDQPWIRSQGKQVAMNVADIYVTVRGRYAENPGKIERIVKQDAAVDLMSNILDMVQQTTDGNMKIMVPLSSLALQWTYWALRAPKTRTGPKG